MNNLTPSKDDTKFFKGIKVTRSREQELKEFNDRDTGSHSFYQGIMGKEIQLFLAIVWLLVAVVCDPLFTDNTFKKILGSVGLVFGFGSLLMFVIFHGITLLISLVKIVWKWFIGLVAVMLVIASCAPDGDTGREKLNSDFDIITIDSCEYVQFDYGFGDQRVYSLTHKGNCKNEIHKN